MKCTKVIISLNSEELYKKVRQVLLYETDKKEVKKILTQTARSISNDDLIELKADLIKEENIDIIEENCDDIAANNDKYIKNYYNYKVALF